MVEGDKLAEARRYEADILSFKWSLGCAKDAKYPGKKTKAPFLVFDGRF